MELTEIMVAVQELATKKDTSIEEIAQVKSQLQAFETKGADAQTKTSAIEAELLELKESFLDLETKGHYNMDVENTKAFDMNIELKSLAKANPQADILSKGLTSEASSAGATIRTEYEAGIVKPLREQSAFLSLIGHKSIPSEDYKRLVRVSNAGMRWAGENVNNSDIANTGTQAYAEVTGVFGKAEAYPFVTQEMLDDSAFDLQSELSESVIEEIGDGVAKAALAGDGVKKPKGLLATTTGADHEKFEVLTVGAAGKFGANTTAAVKSLRTIARSLKTGYRANAKWLMSEETRDTVLAFVYADGKSIINEDLTEMPDGRLLGKEIVIDSNMPENEIVYGDFERGFTFLTVRGLSVLPNPYAKAGNVQFYHAMRVGTMVNDTQALKIVKLKA